jgi:hypothetical protein
MPLLNYFDNSTYPSFYNNNYTFKIKGGKHKNNRYVEMKHQQQYSVLMYNNTNTSCRATLKIDGEHMGNFYISSNNNIDIDRPVHSSKIFTFYRTDRINPTPYRTGIIPGNPINGLVEVTFVPSKVYNYNLCNTYMSRPSCNDTLSGCYEEGGTGLSGYSHQQFADMGNMDLDFSKKVTLSYRLVGSNHNSFDYYDVQSIHFKQRRPPPIIKREPYVKLFPLPINPFYPKLDDGYIDPLLYK